MHYAVHLTGHGWRNSMRPDEALVYQVTKIRPPPAVFRFIEKVGPVGEREMYATFNMGVGFALYVAPADEAICLRLAAETGHAAWRGGTVRRQGNRKAVEITPLGINFEGDTLQVR